MKDVLLKIMIKEGLINDERKDHPSVVYSISKIADIVKAFDEWKDKNTTRTYKDKYYVSKTAAMKDLTYNDLFNFWYNEIREK